MVQVDEAAVPYLRPSFDACFSLCCVCRYELDGQGEMLSANLEIVPVILFYGVTAHSSHCFSLFRLCIFVEQVVGLEGESVEGERQGAECCVGWGCAWSSYMASGWKRKRMLVKCRGTWRE